MPVVNFEKLGDYVLKNTDPYGKCCVDVALRVMEYLDQENEFNPHYLICRADNDIKAGGITGYMAGVAAQIVAEVHSRGEEFRKAWNKEYGVGEDHGGTVNLAILTLGPKGE